MGVRVCHDREQRVAVLYCSTTGIAFGPVFEHDEAAEVEDFLGWLAEEGADWAAGEGMTPTCDGPHDARCWSASDLETIKVRWSAVRNAEAAA